MTEPDEGMPAGSPEPKWLRFGVAVAVLQSLFVLLVVVLLRIDRTLALGVAVGLSVVGGVVVTLFVLYVY